MKLLKFIPVLFVSILLISYISVSQEDVLRPEKGYIETKGKVKAKKAHRRLPLTLGVEGGLNYNLFSQNMTWTIQPHGTIFDGLTSADGISPHFGILADWGFGERFGAQLRLSFDAKWFGVKTSGYDYVSFPSIYPPGSTGNMDLTVDVVANYFTFTPLFRINIIKNLFVTVGPTFHFLLGDVETTWKPTVINGPGLENYDWWRGMGFAGTSGNKTVVEPDPVSTRVGIETGIGYKISIGEHFSIVPQGRFQLMFSPVVKENTVPYNSEFFIEKTTDKMLHSLVFAVGFWYSF